MSDSALDNAIKERKELQEQIRLALERLGEIEKFLQMHRQFAMNDGSRTESPAGETFGRAGTGLSQAVFEMYVTKVLREMGRPLQSGEIVEEFQKRDHPVGGHNPVKQAWNRLWEAKVRNVLVHLPPYGYWLANEPIPEDVPIPEGPRRRLSNPRRHVKSVRGRKPTLTKDVLDKARTMLLAGKTFQQVADELGGFSTNALYRYFPGGIKALKAEEFGEAPDEK